MKDIRIGNDISVRWSLYRGDEAYDLTNLPVTLYLKNAYGKKEIKDYTIEGNQISWTFFGKDQKNTGKYSMVLVIREGEQGMASTDYCDFVQLVSCACQVSGVDDENVQTETIELTSEVDFPPIKVDTTLSESSLNPIANKAVAEKFAEVEGRMALQPDWNQSDPISKDYIKNRTHGIVFHGDPRKSNYNGFLKSLTNPMIMHVGGNTIATFHTGYHSLYDYDTFLFQLSWDATADNILDGIIPTNQSVSVGASTSVVLTFKTFGSVTEDGEFVEHYQTTISFNDSEGLNVDEVISALCEQYCLLISEDFEIAKLDEKYIPDTIARQEDIESVLDETVALWENVESKVDKVEGKGLSTNDYTNEDKDKLTELSAEVSKLQNEVIYPDPLFGVEFGTWSGDVLLKKILKSIWVDILDPNFELPEKWYAYFLRNDASRSPQFMVQICHTQPTGANVIFTFSAENKGVGVEEIICNGYGSYNGKVNLHMVLDFNETSEDINTTNIRTEFIVRELNKVKPEVKPVGLAIHNIENNLRNEAQVLNKEIFDINYILKGDFPPQYLKSKQTRIAIYLDNTPNASQYKLKISSENPTTNIFSIYKTKPDHSGLEAYVHNAYIGDWVVIDRDEEKPCLYIYYTDITDEVIDPITYLVEFQSTSSLIQEVEDLKVKESSGLSWKGKTIVCFGDSLTEFKDHDNSKTYSDYIQELTEANVINIGVGGTQFRRRVSVVDVPTNSNQAYAALDIISMVKACCEQDFAKQIAATNYLTQSNLDANDAIIARMQTIDWSKVDVVTFFGGTNDWNNAPSYWGEDNSTEENYTFGAINEIVRMIMTTYPHVHVYWFTPIVRWLKNDADERTEETFSDNMQKGDATLKEFSARIEAAIKKHHIPVCDMYNTLGWNMYNFSQFFTDTDGTHPRKGKGTEQIARKIIAFINANKTF